MLTKKSKHHSEYAYGTIAVDPYRFNDGIRGIVNLAELMDVGYFVGVSGGCMFIEYPRDESLIEMIDELIDNAYRERKQEND